VLFTLHRKEVSMSMNLSFSGQLSQQQQLNLAPQLLQWLRLLQVPAQSLDQLVRGELESNPALEQDELSSDAQADDADLLAAADAIEPHEDWPGLEERFSVLADIDSQWVEETSLPGTTDRVSEQERHNYQMQSITGDETLATILLQQIAVCAESDTLKRNAALLVGMLDERGYVSETMAEIAAELDISVEAAEQALALVQSLDPVGVGARDLSECLQLQLCGSDAVTRLARRVVKDCLHALAQGRVSSIANHLGVTEAEVSEAIAMIRTLNPAPGKSVGGSDIVQEVTPDIVIELSAEGEFEISVVDDSLPRLRISRYCRSLIEKGNLTADEMSYLRGRIRAASFLIDGIEKRGTTLRRIAEEIIRVQHHFLRGDEGDVRPLTMAKVAGIIGVHDTTVSRALAEKYVQTPVGLFPMKKFFCVGYRCDDGSAMTPEMVRRRIETMIMDEEPESPVRDEDIAAKLQEEGIPVARRTVAKYRGELGIPSSKERMQRTRPLRVLAGGKKTEEEFAPAVAMMG
jgi:RNA polymerase sigma-54 factor